MVMVDVVSGGARLQHGMFFIRGGCFSSSLTPSLRRLLYKRPR